MKVGITGQPGFVGSHLFNYLGLVEDIRRMEFRDEYFQDNSQLDAFTSGCDVIVHLAAMNRHPDPEMIYQTNIRLVQLLIDSFHRNGATPHVIFSSSTQEDLGNPYGRSKKEGRDLLADWAASSGGKFTGLIIPNVFGPFCNPNYNSFVATFAHKMTRNEQPEIHVDAPIDLIYVQDLVKQICHLITGKIFRDEYRLPHLATSKPSEILEKFRNYQELYLRNGIVPELGTWYETCLFNTFRSYIPEEYFPRIFTLHTDDRGSFVETVKAMGPGQSSFSVTRPGVTRGNHFHLRKIERFAVIRGEAVIRLRRIGRQQILEYRLSGEKPGYVDIPVWYAHNITNTGNTELLTLFWINEFFDPLDPDTFFEKV